MKRPAHRICALWAIMIGCWSPAAIAAPYQTVVNASKAAVAASDTNGVVVQVEAPVSVPRSPPRALNFAPNVSDPQFKNVRLVMQPGAANSDHSNTVAQLFYGARRSIARGIHTAYVFPSTHWLARLSQWDLNPDHTDNLFPGPVVNHSWVANSRSAANLLRRADYSAVSNNILHVTGVRRRGAGDHLMAGGYNALVVGGSTQNIDTPYPPVDAFYDQGRTRPHLVGPYPHASAAAPIVSAAAVRLNALAADRDMLLAKTRHGSAQLPVELVRAIFMASARGNFEIEAKGEVVVNAFGTLGVTDNGLDKRFGMGMLNVDAAEDLFSIGADAVGDIYAEQGFTYNAIATKGVNDIRVTPDRDGWLQLSLSWLADIRVTDTGLLASLPDFDLQLLASSTVDSEQRESEHTAQDDHGPDAPLVLLAQSAARADSTENLRVRVERGRDYVVRIVRRDDGDPWPVALAWYRH